MMFMLFLFSEIVEQILLFWFRLQANKTIPKQSNNPEKWKKKKKTEKGINYLFRFEIELILMVSHRMNENHCKKLINSQEIDSSSSNRIRDQNVSTLRCAS